MHAITKSILKHWCISKLLCRIYMSSKFNSVFTLVSSSGDENWPVVPMMMFLMQNDPNWNLQSRQKTDSQGQILSHSYVVHMLLLRAFTVVQSTTHCVVVCLRFNQARSKKTCFTCY